MNFAIRTALQSDVPILRTLIEESVRVLQAKDYSPSQLESALASVYGVDTQLIADGTYFVVETVPLASHEQCEIVGCGGWSKRKTLYGGDQWSRREDELLDPAVDAAKIRAFFIKPAFTRRGLGSMILQHCEQAARAHGFGRLEMGATLTGVALYKARGYEALEHLEVPLANGEGLPIVRMAKQFSLDSASPSRD
ncbi:MAG TPA: GNAT family N-acetyltransferase [Chroococcales cyanobacterium]